MTRFVSASFDIHTASFYSLLDACHRRLLEIQKADEKRHMMDQDMYGWDSLVEEELMPLLERIIYWEPTDDEINAPLQA